MIGERGEEREGTDREEEEPVSWGGGAGAGLGKACVPWSAQAGCPAVTPPMD